MAQAIKLPSRKYLHKRLRYEPDTGKLFWKHYAPYRSHWNAKHAGKEALTSGVTGYRSGSIDGRKYLAHRVIYKMMTGQEPPQIDHINGDRQDNRVANLRAANDALNGKNKAMLCTNTSGHVGVYWSREHGKWRAQIKEHGKVQYLGIFVTKEEAVAARVAAQEAMGFSPRHGTPA